MSRHNPLITPLLPKDVPTRDIEFMEFYSTFNTSMMPIAFLISLHRNRSLKWAVIHALLGAPYVAWSFAESLSGSNEGE